MRGGPIFFDQFEMIAEGVLEQNRLRLGAQSLTQPRAVEFHRLFLSQSPVNPVETVAADFNANNRRAMQFFVFRQGLAAKKNTDAAARTFTNVSGNVAARTSMTRRPRRS
jgi:hypothetical protein